MKSDLFIGNTPDKFWLCWPSVPTELWQTAIEHSLNYLELPQIHPDVLDILTYVFGEESYGSNSWSLNRFLRIYYILKPYIPRSLIMSLRTSYQSKPPNDPKWFIDDRYVKFIWAVLDFVSSHVETSPIHYQALWRDQKQFAVALTHDIESAQGQSHARELADIDESFGFRSAFFFVPESYPLDYGLIAELRERGFEVGIHGLKHDGKLFFSKRRFLARALRINQHLKKLDAVGFAAPLTHRQGEWMQALNIKYDRSFFDVDRLEPMPGGVMTIYPYFLGGFVELPYTLLQDYTLSIVLREKTPRIWLEKLDFIQQYHGLALLNTHPDYLGLGNIKCIYTEFLQEVSRLDNYWHAVPGEIAQWWRERNENPTATTLYEPIH